MRSGGSTTPSTRAYGTPPTRRCHARCARATTPKSGERVPNTPMREPEARRLHADRGNDEEVAAQGSSASTRAHASEQRWQCGGERVRTVPAAPGAPPAWTASSARNESRTPPSYRHLTCRLTSKLSLRRTKEDAAPRHHVGCEPLLQWGPGLDVPRSPLRKRSRGAAARRRTAFLRAACARILVKAQFHSICAHN